jgi:predicted nucleotidyltransferase
MDQDMNTLRDILTAHLQDRPEILFAILYGSANEGDRFRDLDVALWVDRAVVPVAGELAYAFTLADVLEASTGYPVDVRVINDAPLPFRYNVSRGQKLVARDEEAYYTFLERTRMAWWDFEPVAMAYLREMAE